MGFPVLPIKEEMGKVHQFSPQEQLQEQVGANFAFFSASDHGGNRGSASSFGSGAHPRTSRGTDCGFPCASDKRGNRGGASALGTGADSRMKGSGRGGEVVAINVVMEAVVAARTLMQFVFLRSGWL